MKKYLSLFLLLFILSCNSNDELQGIWTIVYHLNEENKVQVSSEKILLEFNKGLINTTSIGDTYNEDLKKIIRGRKGYYNKEQIVIDGDAMNYKLLGDSITLFYEKLETGNNKTILKRLNPSLSKSAPCKMVMGSYYVQTNNNSEDKHLINNITFINDSLLLHTGDYDVKYPLKDWGIVEFKGFQLFLIYSDRFPLALIESCSDKQIKLNTPTNPSLGVNLKLIKNANGKQTIFGTWKVIEKRKWSNSVNWKKSIIDLQDIVEINTDSISFLNRKKASLKWELSSDMNRIYFIDKIFEEDGSWKLISLKNDEMTILITGNSESQMVDTLKLLKIEKSW